MKRILFYMGHPAHYHLFKHSIGKLIGEGKDVRVVIKTKDVLETLLRFSGFDYFNLIPRRRGNNKLRIILKEFEKYYALFKYSVIFRPELMVGTSSAMPLVGKFLGIPTINVNEDDSNVVPMYAKTSYPFSTEIVTPIACNNGRWNNKSIKYNGYHELAYLHPKYFKPDFEVASKYLAPFEPYFLIRFSKLDAHHDKGIRGIRPDIAANLISILKRFGKVYISSERELDTEMEPFRININPLHIHHVMAYSRLFIGDSQTMCAEAGVLGTPFIRFNDFVGRIGYLKELEQKYELGFGIKPVDVASLFKKVKELLSLGDLKVLFHERQKRMLQEKIDVSAFFFWLIKNYPRSVQTTRNTFGPLPKVFDNAYW